MDDMTTVTPLVIVASSGAASELVGIVQQPRPDLPAYRVCAIVGHGELLADIAGRLEVALVGELVEARAPAGSRVAITTGDRRHHQALVATAATLGLPAASLIHRDATIGPWVEIGQGAVIAPGVRITGNVTIGAHCQLHTGAIVSHDDVLGEFVTLSPAATLCGGVRVGPRSTIFAGATVLPGVTIGADATVGAGALVHRDVPDGATVVGVPARMLASS